MPRSLQKGQAIFRGASRPYPSNTRQALYLTVLKESMGGMLGQQETFGKEQAIYCLSKNSQNANRVWASKRLRHYMLAHSTSLIAKTDPLKYIFEKPVLIGRIPRWQMALFEYNIVYTNQKAIKDEQIMVTEETNVEAKSNEWRLWFDGASNLLANGDRGSAGVRRRPILCFLGHVGLQLRQQHGRIQGMCHGNHNGS
ncbi:hypothetical protein CR513_47426, partial [Mucuna pruriens]